MMMLCMYLRTNLADKIQIMSAVVERLSWEALFLHSNNLSTALKWSGAPFQTS